MQEFEVKSDESCALFIFKGETINGLPLNWLIWGNKAIFEPFILTRFWFNCLSLNEFLIAINTSSWRLGSISRVCLAFVPGRKMSQKLAGFSYCYSLRVVRKTSTTV